MRDIREFRGYREGFHPYNQRDNYATYAKNLWQTSGEFSPMCDNLAVPYGFTALPGLQSIQIARRNDGTYSTIQIPDISLAEGIATEDDRENLYFYDGTDTGIISLANSYTDDITYSRVFGLANAQPPGRVSGTFFAPDGTSIGLPLPGERTADTTIVATYLTVDGHESAASFASRVFSYDYDDEMFATVWVPMSAAIDRLRIYMAVAGEFRLIREEPITLTGVGLGGNLTGTTLTENILATTRFTLDPNDTTVPLVEWAVPPKNPLQNLINISGGRIAGVAQDRRSVWISDPENPISFPHRIPMANRVVRIIRSGEDLLVLTDGRPSVITGYETPYEQELDFSEPCISADSVVDMGFAIMYASPNGICAIERYSGSILTMDNRYDGNIEIIDHKKWRARPTSTIKATSYQGRYLYYMTDGTGTWKGTAFNTQYGELIDMPDLAGDNIFFVKNPDASIGGEALDIYSQIGDQLTVERFMYGNSRLLGEWVRDFEVLESEPIVYARIQSTDYAGCSLTIDGGTSPVTDDRHFTVKSANRKRVVTHRLEGRGDIQSLKTGHDSARLY